MPEINKIINLAPVGDSPGQGIYAGVNERGSIVPLTGSPGLSAVVTGLQYIIRQTDIGFCPVTDHELVYYGGNLPLTTEEPSAVIGTLRNIVNFNLKEIGTPIAVATLQVIINGVSQKLYFPFALSGFSITPLQEK